MAGRVPHGQREESADSTLLLWQDSVWAQDPAQSKGLHNLLSQWSKLRPEIAKLGAACRCSDLFEEQRQTGEGVG